MFWMKGAAQQQITYVLALRAKSRFFLTIVFSIDCKANGFGFGIFEALFGGSILNLL